MDAAELKDTLEKLQDVLPGVPPRFEALVKQAGDVREKAHELLEDFEQADSRADDLFKEIDAALKRLAEDVATNREAILANLEQVEQGIHELDAVERARDTLQASTDASGEAMEAFQNRLVEGIEAVKTAGDAFREALDDLKEETEEGREALSNALEAADDAAEALQAAINEGKESVTETIDNLASEIKETQEEFANQLESYLDAADDLRETFTSGLQDVLNDVIKEPVEDLVEEMTGKISGELKELVDSAMNEIKEALQGLGESVSGAKSGSEGGRGLLEPLFDQVEHFMGPIESVIDAVRSAANTVGIDF